MSEHSVDTISVARRFASPLAMLTRVLEPVRYLAASVVALVVDLSTFSIAMRWLGLNWSAAACVGFLLGAGVAYTLSIRFVFGERSQREHPLRELAIFVLIGALGLLVTQAVLWICIGQMSLHAEGSRLLAAGATFFFNYSVRASLLFRERNEVMPS